MDVFHRASCTQIGDLYYDSGDPQVGLYAVSHIQAARQHIYNEGRLARVQTCVRVHFRQCHVSRWWFPATADGHPGQSVQFLQRGGR